MPKLVCIGGSTGAPLALADVLKSLSPEFPVPILVALHMPGEMTASYARNLASRCGLRVLLAHNNSAPEPASVYIGPGGMHIGLSRARRIVVTPNPQETAFKPCIDVLFYTAAQAVGSDVIAVVMTGLSTAKDAVRGALAVKKAEGRVLVQNDPANPFLGMPKNVIEAGAATDVVQLADIARRLAVLTR